MICYDSWRLAYLTRQSLTCLRVTVRFSLFLIFNLHFSGIFPTFCSNCSNIDCPYSQIIQPKSVIVNNTEQIKSETVRFRCYQQFLVCVLRFFDCFFVQFSGFLQFSDRVAFTKPCAETDPDGASLLPPHNAVQQHLHRLLCHRLHRL